MFWLAITHFQLEISLGALVVLSVATVFALADKSAHQLGINISFLFGGVIVSAIIEVQTDFAHIILPEWNAGNGLGIIVVAPVFIVAGALTILAATITSLLLALRAKRRLQQRIRSHWSQITDSAHSFEDK